MNDDDDDDDLLRAIAHAPDVTPPDDERDGRIGTTLRAKYKLEHVLGEGGMAIVYAATHRNSKRFAIKVLRQKLSTSTEARQRFVREGYVANTVAHRGAVEILDDDVAEDGSAFIVMELLDGAPLDRLIGKNGISPEAALGIGAQVCDVLAAAHAKGIIHRDIKPQNLFLERSGEVKVLDFGIARMRAAASEIDTTQSGVMMGTPAFMPPEQALGRTKEIDGQSDLWALGATLFTMLTGRTVHDGASGQEVAVRSATQPARKVTSVVPGIPRDVASIVDRALAFTKADRWPSAAAMRDACVRVHRERFGNAPSPDALTSLFSAAPAVAAPLVPRNKSARFVVLAVSGVVLAGVGALTLRTHPTPAVAAPSPPPSHTALADLAPSTEPSTTLEPIPTTSASIAVPRPLLPSSTAHTKSCDPPYTVDPTGKRIPKPECL